MKPIKYMLLCIPLSILGRLLHLHPIFVFITICLSILPLAAVIGNTTEQLAIFTGSKIGGLINATMSNIPELLIGFFAVKSGFYTLVLASMAGSIIGNILLVLGLSILLGGFRHKFQIFDKNIARSNFILLFFAAMSIIIPFAFKYAMGAQDLIDLNAGLTAISLSMSLILIMTYVAGLVFSLITHRNIFVKQEDHTEEPEKAKWSFQFTLFLLISASVFVAIESEMLVSSIEQIINQFRFPEVFIGIILIPILGNMAENVSAIFMAVKNKVDVCIEIAIGSSIQISLFVAPILILLSFLLGNPMLYVFDPFEVVSILIAIGLSLYVFQDGKTNWLEGVVLVGCYFLLGVAFFFI